jgi:hypothetical protein
LNRRVKRLLLIVEETSEVHSLAGTPDHPSGSGATDRSAEMIPPLIEIAVT